MLRTALALGLALLAASPAAAASVDGVEIHSTVQGLARGETIIFVHGWTCDESSWAAQVADLGSSYRVVTLDLPGHGKTAAPAAFSMDLFARAVEAVRQDLGADKVVLVGHSMGAAVIREYALDYPEHVAGLVAVDGPLDVRPLADFPGAGQPLTREVRSNLIDSMFVPATTPELRAQIKAVMLGTSDATAAGAGAAMFDPANQSDKPIAAPALSIYAGNPTWGPDTVSRTLLPDWSYEQFAGAGHFLMLEQPERFNAVLRAFVEQRATF